MQCNECNFRSMNVTNETLATWIMFLNFYFCLPICWSTSNKQFEKAISRSLNNSCTCFYLHCSFGFVLSNAFSHNRAQRYILIFSCPLKIFWLSYTSHYNPSESDFAVNKFKIFQWIPIGRDPIKMYLCGV